MKRVDKILWNLIFGAVIPVGLFLSFWWISVIYNPESKIIFIFAFAGMGLGLLINLIIGLSKKITFYHLSGNLLALIYVFYAFGMFGFFMGVPVFHPVLGLFAGYYQGRKLIFCEAGPEIRKIRTTQTALFTALVMAVICILSAGFALLDEFTASNLQMMFALNFEITRPILLTIILAGGAGLILLQYLLTRWTMKWTLSNYAFPE